MRASKPSLKLKAILSKEGSYLYNNHGMEMAFGFV
jgi:hypothetical protein